MGKRKAKNQTLTKIDPSVLKPKPAAVSQHAACDGTCVTTAIKPPQPPVTPEDLFDFNVNPADVGDEWFEDDDDEECASVVQVCAFLYAVASWDSPILGQSALVMEA